MRLNTFKIKHTKSICSLRKITEEKKWVSKFTCNDRVSHISYHNSPTARARKLFKSYKYPESLLVSMTIIESFEFRFFL